MSRTEYVTLALKYQGQTDRAVRVDADALDAPVWIPLTALHFTAHKTMQSASHGDEIELRVDEDVARKKGLL